MFQNLKVLICIAILLFVLPFSAFAGEISIRPFLIDETLIPRDIVSKLITVSSDYEHRKAVLYATVNEITVDNEGEIKEFISPVMTDRTTNPASWVEISRGRIEVPAKETREVPFIIRIHPYAEPGVYHVFVGVVEAPNRPTAQAKAMAGDADGVIVKITIADQRTDALKITSFNIERFITGEDSKQVNIELENIGDLAAVPSGEIIFYDSRGVEVTSMPVEGAEIVPGETQNLSLTMPLEDDLGRYKANLRLNYGKNQTASLYDTTFFYLMPLHMMLVLFLGVLVVSILIVFLLRRAFAVHEYDDTEDVVMYVREGHDPNPQDHDIDLKNNQ
ncbi:hypothetical protein KC851_02225 [Candidatus Kaiserbacteria bacterium]|nr:hypothetical protein [Candidatus Kaiserbacteria bacterium]